MPTIVDLASQAGRRHRSPRARVGPQPRRRSCPRWRGCEPRAIDVTLLFLDALDAGPRPALRRHSPPAPVRRRGRRAARGDRARTRAARPGASPGRSRDRHDRPQRAPAQGAVWSARSTVDREPSAAGRRRELRVQARAAARRRHRDGRPVPAEPALGGRAASADRSRPEGARLRARTTASTSSFLDHFDELLGRRACRSYQAEGRVVPDDRDRLHGRSPSFGRRSPRSWPRRFAARGIVAAHVAPRRRRRAADRSLGTRPTVAATPSWTRGTSVG